MSFLTVQEVAARLNMSPSCIYQLIESGKLSHHRIGMGRGAIRVSEEDLAAYLATCRVESASAAPRREPRPRLKHIRI